MPAAAPEARSIYLRESWRARLAVVLFPLVVLAVLVAGAEGTTRVIGWIFLGLLVLAELFRILRPVAVLTPEKIVVLNMRPQEVAWHRVTDITTQKRFGSNRIALLIDNGDRVVMDGPAGNFLARGHFDRAIGRIRQHWAQHRATSGTAEAPAPQPGAGEPRAQ